jgi:hypothetical protein
METKEEVKRDSFFAWSTRFGSSDDTGSARRSILHINAKPLAPDNAGWSIKMAASATKPQNSHCNTTKDNYGYLESDSFPPQDWRY